LKLFEDALQKNDTTHFPSCQELKENENYVIDLAEFNELISEISEEFHTRFNDFDSLKPKLQIFNNPMDTDEVTSKYSIFKWSYVISLTPWCKNPNVHHSTYNSQPPVPILSQSNPIHTPQANLPKIHSDPIFLPTPWSSNWSLSFGLSRQNLVHFSLLSHACHMPRPPHSP
jgi:hypothetical protein